MEQATQQRIIDAVGQARSELSDWLRKEGWSEAELLPIFSAIMHENGTFAAAILDKASKVLGLDGVGNVRTAQVGKALQRVISGEFAESLLSEPEPTPERLDQSLVMAKNALANLRQHLLSSAKNGPRHKGGGRPKELPDPEVRKKIRDGIRRLRGPGVRLQDLHQRFADKNGVSPTTIKRIWLEDTDEGQIEE